MLWACNINSTTRWVAVLCLTVFGLTADADEWMTYRVGTFSLQVPTTWTIKYQARDTEVRLNSPDGRAEFAGFWWLPDEPLLSGANVVSHMSMRVAGQPATFVHSTFRNGHFFAAVMDRPRADGRRFFLSLAIETRDPRAAAAVFHRFLARVDETRPAPNGQPEKTAAQHSSQVPFDVGKGRYYTDEIGGFSIRYPSAWSLNRSDREGARIVALAPPGRAAVLVIAAKSASSDIGRDPVSDFEKLYYEEYVVPDNVKADGDMDFAGLRWRFTDVTGQVHAIEGIRPSFANGASRLMAHFAPDRSFVIARVNRLNAPESLLRTLSDIVGSFRVKPLAPAPHVKDATPAPGDAETAPPDGGTFACPRVDLATWRHPSRATLERTPNVRLHWVELCEDGRIPVFGVDFPYDAQGATRNFFYPLLVRMLDANDGWPVQFVDYAFGMVISAAYDSDGALKLDYAELPPEEARPPIATDAIAQKEAPEPQPVDTEPAKPPPLFDASTGLLEPVWKEMSFSGGDFAQFARFDGDFLVIDVPAGHNWGKTGIYSAESVVTFPAGGDDTATKITVAFDPARTQDFVVALIPAGGDPADEWGYHDIRVGLDRKAKAAELWIQRQSRARAEFVADHPIDGLSIVLRPDRIVLVTDQDGRILLQTALGADLELSAKGYHLAVLAHATAANEATRLALRSVALGEEETSGSTDPAAWESAEEIILFDGRILAGYWQPFSAHGGDYSRHARLENSALVVDVPTGNGGGKVGVRSNPAVVWLDPLGPGGEVRLTLDFDPDRTTGLAVALTPLRGLDGNDPSSPRLMLLWRDTGEGKGEVLLYRDDEQEPLLEAEPDATAPATLSFVLTPQQVRVEAEGIPEDPFDWPSLRRGAGLQLYVYSHVMEADRSVRMALRRIAVSRQAGAPVTAPEPAAGVPELPVTELFAGTPGEFWEPAAVNGPDSGACARFTGGQMIATVPDGMHWWGKCGLLSTGPVLDLDERIRRTPYRVAFRVDPEATTGLQVLLSSERVADMWASRAMAVALVHAREGVNAGRYVLDMNGGPYEQWQRTVDAGWMQENWNGTLELVAEQGWLVARIPGGGPVLRAPLSLEVGTRLFMTVLAHPERPDEGAQLALEEIAAGWVTPEGMTAPDRWELLDTEGFDPAAFVTDLQEELFGSAEQ